MLTYSLADRGNESLYVYLYRCLRRDIEEGVIAPGERLPSKRAFAEHLGVSVITVEGAYAQLQAEGYVQAVPRRGYYASDLTATRASQRPAPAVPWHEVPPAVEAPAIADLTAAAGGAGIFPYALWAKVVREVLTCASEETLLREAHPAGSPRLRRSLAAYLRGSRGMEVDPSCIVVGAGAQVLYNAIVQLLGRHVAYAVENPGYPRLTAIYGANDVQLAHIPLDEQGIAVDSLIASGAQVAHVMPSHQYPTGMVTSVGRRYELLAWASGAPDRYIIEDDYDCEFRMAGRPIPSLQSVDACGRVIYTNTFSKSMGAAFRLGYMVLPPELAQLCACKLGFYSCTVSVIEQLALACFIEQGHYERHVARARTRYRRTRDALMAALRGSAFGDRLVFEGADGGLHFLMGVAGCAQTDKELAVRARERGVALAPLSAFWVQQSQGPAVWPLDQERRWFVVSYSGVDCADIPPLIAALEQVLSRK